MGVCERNTERITCTSGDIIEIIHANYGRTSRTVCARNAMKNTQCHSQSSFNKTQGMCNGRKSCELFASNSLFGDPCIGTYKYLDVLYMCVQPGKHCTITMFSYPYTHVLDLCKIQCSSCWLDFQSVASKGMFTLLFRFR